MDDEPDTQELRERQLERERSERELASDAEDPQEEAAHARRAEKSAYLRRKLEERADSEREQG
ncbi:MAG: hypothetical protein JOZ73_04510 [Solirubrobacterales bacterium]|nr:hypothetical protein [Solirubrobacterales bacterium]